MTDPIADHYQTHSSMLISWLRSRTGDAELAEEIASQTWLKVVRSYDQFDGENFRAWLFQIASRNLTDFFRKKRPISSEKISESVSSVLEPSTELSHREQKQREQQVLQECLGELPEERLIVVRARFRSESYQSISESTGVSEKTLMTRYHRAQQELRDCVERKL